jgi:hypothetical protein
LSLSNIKVQDRAFRLTPEKRQKNNKKREEEEEEEKIFNIIFLSI